MIKKEDFAVNAIFCLSFGKRDNGLGLSNEFLIDKILEFYKNKPLPLIIQKDCADYLPKNINVDKVISQHRIFGKYLDTSEVIRQCVKYCADHGYKKVLVFAHPDHLKRVRKNLKHQGLEFEIADTILCPYDPKSSQWWTRNKIFFMLREVMVFFYDLIIKQ